MIPATLRRARAVRPHIEDMPEAVGWGMTPRSRPLREDVASTLIQGAAAVATVVGVAHLLTAARAPLGTRSLAAIVVYGVSMVMAFLASAGYHGVRHRRAKAMLQKLDHCSIFLFIAGTYTPVALLPLWEHKGAILLAAIWGLAIAGIVLRLAREPQFGRIAIPLYLIMGWLCAGWGVALYLSVGAQALAMMAAGGFCYTGGLLFHRRQRMPFSNPIWHLCVVAGSAFFYFAILGFLAA